MIPLPVLPALTMFSETLTAFDETPTLSRGRVIGRVTGENYSIRGSFQPMGPKMQRLLPEGTSAAGKRVLRTRRRMSFINTTEGGNSSNTQSFIRYRGEIWRVMEEMDWSAYGAFNGYICEKHLRHGDS